MHIEKIQEVKDTLKKHGLRYTACRQDMLLLFKDKREALSHPEIEAILSDDYDRVTLYRTLNSFEESGIIHRVIDDGGAARYATCSGGCETHEHHDNHVHFKCKVCGKVRCLEETEIPTIALSPDYVAEEINLLVLGKCPDCR
ncbi:MULTISPECIES: Fur family transcriptional regulator [Persicobacter]|uniref:Transcriptional regulator n=1 Tax=Persicobacter diffluens TaxID=981 RepID=A0AAN4W151_9BACT|nr:Fur family transcriptional regulator [Persicobacter sp. CCB-QB2]GJM62402.1 transcriptional regulator [Persicobacter diffluens]